MTTTQIKIRIPARRLKKVRAILTRAGTDVGSIVNMLFAKIENDEAIPFEMFSSSSEIETRELLANPEFMDTLCKYRAGKLKMIPLRSCAE